MTFSSEVRAEDVVGQAALWLHIVTAGSSPDPEAHGPAIAGSRDWTRHQLTAQVPADADLIRFGLTVTGPGRVRLRNVELTPSPSS